MSEDDWDIGYLDACEDLLNYSTAFPIGDDPWERRALGKFAPPPDRLMRRACEMLVWAMINARFFQSEETAEADVECAMSDKHPLVQKTIYKLMALRRSDDEDDDDCVVSWARKLPIVAVIIEERRRRVMYPWRRGSPAQPQPDRAQGEVR